MTAEQHTELPPRSPSPFTYSDADVILRTTDNFNFRVHKIVLSLASPVFRTTFQLPQRQILDANEQYDGLPAITLAEPSTIIHILLYHIYPMPTRPGIPSDILVEVMVAAQKYEIDILLNLGRVQVARIAELDSLRAFVYAIRLGWKEEADHAAFASLKHPFSRLLSDSTLLRELRADEYGALICYHRTCSTVASEILLDVAGGKHRLPNQCCGRCKADGIIEEIGLRKEGGYSSRMFPRWTLGFLLKTAKELEQAPRTPIMTSPMMTKALHDAATCDGCRSQVTAFKENVSSFQQQIDAAIENVERVKIFHY